MDFLFTLCYGIGGHLCYYFSGGYDAREAPEHLNEPLHILVEAELPVGIIDARLMQVREILEDLLKPVVCHQLLYPFKTLSLLAFKPIPK